MTVAWDRHSLAALHVVEHRDVRLGEGCVDCGTPIEAFGGFRVGAYLFHAWSPDLLCDACAERLAPALADEAHRRTRRAP